MSSLLETYKLHKISPERRRFTRKILKNLKASKEKRIREGEIYCVRYQGDKLVDKWHAVSVCLVHEIVGNRIVVHNLLYLNESTLLNILQQAEKLEDYRNSSLKMLIESELSKDPWICTKLTMEASNILRFVNIPRSDWGMIPLLEKHLFGNLNASQLVSDWKKENLTKQKSDKTKKEVEDLKEEFVMEDIESEDFSLEEKQTSPTLSDVRKEILEDDDNDI